ncbi:HD domain-containing protein [Clostridium sp. CS001]|uniref:HD domain-containing protein n=1 Tax=Clostridium sp. CS001 TaxID=2880648 RepID=UPI001CF3288F|nr:HD domain-containing protein [Clostridium sp. CS001]MCB2291043.1 HD domain-containing protein [Clostridium sp. CS001]
MEIIDNNLINDKINIIIENNNFQNNLKKIEGLEKDRVFCKHDIQHFLDVARLMYIVNLEDGLNIPKHMIYATALLHDIGRGEEYENGTPHEIASVIIAKNILVQCKYDTKEIDEILEAIGSHRNNSEELNSLSHLLYKCDKLSRNCLSCRASDNCKWPVEKKNLKITY